MQFKRDPNGTKLSVVLDARSLYLPSEMHPKEGLT